MTESRSVLDRLLPPAHRSELIAAGLATHLAFNVVAALAFRLAAQSSSWLAFLLWQVVGNLAGFLTVVALTVLLRFVPLSVAYPITTGLSVIAVQVVAARLLLHEPLPLRVWFGAILIVLGILFVGGRI
jgi:multidrug transporter EmrE-like cation transporter